MGLNQPSEDGDLFFSTEKQRVLAGNEQGRGFAIIGFDQFHDRAAACELSLLGEVLSQERKVQSHVAVVTGQIVLECDDNIGAQA